MILLYTLGLLGTLLLDSVTLDIVVPSTVRIGEAVPITLRLTNTERKPVTVYLQGRPVAFDVIVTRCDGTPVWRRLDGAVTSAILQVRQLAPGAVIEFSDAWSQQTGGGQSVGAGDYLVTGVVPTDPPAELRTRAVPLRILP
jgi:Intracellular proteinase inhibitor